MVVSPPCHPGFPSLSRSSEARAAYQRDRLSVTVVSHHTCRNRRALTLEAPCLPYCNTPTWGSNRCGEDDGLHVFVEDAQLIVFILGIP